MDHFIERQRSRLIGHLKPLDSATLRNIPGHRSRQDLDVCSNFLVGLTMGARQPTLACFAVTADASVEPLSWRAVMTRAGKEEHIVSLIVLQSESYARFRAWGAKVRNGAHNAGDAPFFTTNGFAFSVYHS
jgi:hypothetical protein